METRGAKFWLSLIAILASIFGAFLSSAPVRRTLTLGGIFRTPTVSIQNAASGVTALDGTIQCEDLHYHEPSNLIFTACEENEGLRFSWFPPLGNFDDPSDVYKSQGSIKIINPIVSQRTHLLSPNKHLAHK